MACVCKTAAPGVKLRIAVEKDVPDVEEDFELPGGLHELADGFAGALVADVVGGHGGDDGEPVSEIAHQREVVVGAVAGRPGYHDRPIGLHRHGVTIVAAAADGGGHLAGAAEAEIQIPRRGVGGWGAQGGKEGESADGLHGMDWLAVAPDGSAKRSGGRPVPRARIDAPDWLRHRAAMSTLTIELSDDLAARLAAASEHQHMPPAQIVQEALEKTLPEPLPEASADEPSLYDLMKDGFGCVSSGVRDLATNPKHMEGFGQCRK